MSLPKFLVKIFNFPLLVGVLLILSSLIEPMKVLTDVPRGAMNCPGTTVFNQTAWSLMTSAQHTIYATGCYALNWDVLAFVGGLLIIAIWGWMTK